MDSASSRGTPAGAGAWATTFGALILVALLAVVIGITFLPNPYYVIAQGVIIAGVVVICGSKLRHCYRLAQTAEQTMQLHKVAVWGSFAVFFAAGLLVELATAEKQPTTTVLVVIAFLLALLGALQLAENLLGRDAGANSPPPGDAADETETPPNPA